MSDQQKKYQPTRFINYDPYWIDYDLYKEKYIHWKEYVQKLNKLSPKITDVLLGDSVSYVLFDIAITHHLGIDQAGNMTRVVRDILIGDAYIGEMTKLIAERVQVDARIAQEIASRIVSELFKPAIEDIKKMQAQKFGARIKQDQGTMQSQASTNTHTVNLRPPQEAQQPQYPSSQPRSPQPQQDSNTINLRNPNPPENNNQ
ncbi:MAG: hypothetical protein ABH833_02620 [Parcubacteria group bacterium]